MALSSISLRLGLWLVVVAVERLRKKARGRAGPRGPAHSAGGALFWSANATTVCPTLGGDGRTEVKGTTEDRIRDDGNLSFFVKVNDVHCDCSGE